MEKKIKKNVYVLNHEEIINGGLVGVCGWPLVFAKKEDAEKEMEKWLEVYRKTYAKMGWKVTDDYPDYFCAEKPMDFEHNHVFVNIRERELE